MDSLGSEQPAAALPSTSSLPAVPLCPSNSDYQIFRSEFEVDLDVLDVEIYLPVMSVEAGGNSDCQTIAVHDA